jgi:hypothetical protein
MYLSNRDIRSTGDEPAEFIDVPPTPEDVTLTPPCLSPDDDQQGSS